MGKELSWKQEEVTMQLDLVQKERHELFNSLILICVWNYMFNPLQMQISVSCSKSAFEFRFSQQRKFESEPFYINVFSFLCL